MKKKYFQLRIDIYEKLVLLKKDYNISQSQIAKLVSERTDQTFYAKDVNALNSLQNKSKWKGVSKREKLELFYSSLLEIEEEHFTLSNKHKPDFHIINLVNDAIQAEFQAYRALPSIRKAKRKLTPYYSKNGSALKRIHGILNRNRKRGWVLGDKLNPSTVKMLNCEIEELNETNAIVATKEYWLLVWHNQLTNECDYIYEKIDEQKYILVRNEKTDKFQIDVNSYKTLDKKFIPKVFNENEFDDLLKKDSAEIAKTVRQVIKIGGIDAALQILSTYAEQIDLLEMKNKVAAIQAELNEYTRFLNVGKMNAKNYFEVKPKLILKTLEIVGKFE